MLARLRREDGGSISAEEAAIEAAYVGEIGRLYDALVRAIATKTGNAPQAFAAGLSVALSARAVALDALAKANLKTS